MKSKAALLKVKFLKGISKFLEILKSPDGLSKTRQCNGCQSIECYESVLNEKQIVIWQRWESKEKQQAYIKHRHEDGSFDFLGELVACPPEIIPIQDMVMKTEEEKVRDVINDMCQVDYKVGMKHMHDDCVFIRPSGNPLDKKGWEEMMTNDDVKVESSKLVAVNKVSVCGCCAYVWFWLCLSPSLQCVVQRNRP